MITLEKVMPNGALAKYHKIDRFEIRSDFTCAIVNSYHNTDLQLISWQDTYTIPLEFKVESISDIEALMILEGAPFAGGVRVADEELTLTATKAVAWAKVKTLRYSLINGGVDTPYGRFDSDETSRNNLSAAVFSAFMAKTTGQPFNITWTLQNNDDVELTADTLLEVGQIILKYVDDCHAAARKLRNEIEASETVEEVEQILTGEGWPQ